MTRKEFITLAGIFGLGLPLAQSCNTFGKTSSLQATDKVLIIGAGAAGLTAAYLLQQQGVNTEILEASDHYGGRMKRTTTFADFPIPVGAEWLHTQKDVLGKIVNNPSVNIDIQTTPYDFKKDYALVNGKKQSLKSLGFSIDQKFIGSTWFDFFEQYIVPSIAGKIQFNQIVNAIDYSTDTIKVSTANKEYLANKVILTVPVKVLQNKAIRFTPTLPTSKQKAIDEVLVWDGCKAFLQFDEAFYPTITGFDTQPETAGHKLYYDAAYGQNTQKHILGLFAVGSVAKPYLDKSETERIQYILAELDQLYDGKASQHYQSHIFQDWSKEPFIEGAYVHYFEDWRNFRKLSKAVNEKLFFAGDTYTDGYEWSSVHSAALSARKVVKKLTGKLLL